MLVGHLAAALVAKRLEPRIRLDAAVAAAFGLDLLWPILLLAGVESVQVHPGDTAFTNLAFTSYPWSHGLVMVIVWSLVVGLVAGVRTGAPRVGVVLGCLVASHWVLDCVTHRPDLPLWTGGPLVGLGLWQSVAGTFLVEGGLFVLAAWVYTARHPARDGTGRWAFLVLMALLGILWASQPWAPLPPGAEAVAWGSLILWLVPPWAGWVERHRA